MTFRKILAVLLCAAAVLSVMAVMAAATQAQRTPAALSPVAAVNPVAAKNPVAAQNPIAAHLAPPPPSDEPTTRPTTKPVSIGNPFEWLRNTWSKGKGAYNTWILTWQKILLFGLRVIVLLTNNFAFMRPSA